MINNVSLTGRLTRDIELRYTQGGTAVGSFTLAVDRQFTNQQGQRETDFINCVIWRKSAENLSNFTRKGSLIGVEGHIQTRNYENNQGQRVYVTEVVVENFALLESRATTQARPSEPAQPGDQSNGYNQNFGGQPTQPAPSFGSNPAPSSTPTSKPSTPAGNDNFASQDPFADSGKSIDISDDDLPF
ncbi:single-stranded DNA-binding protein [Lacticaseibacillus absianus]|uniref:single-stranded DNA-binding protein n=1 Tax=Lacticaseibacillus absianus TaxID=2729623 RepID=UPI0015CED96D|nr:single-stranded DNA-binding protein [Lacticaseibacillus absianus]